MVVADVEIVQLNDHDARGLRMRPMAMPRRSQGSAWVIANVSIVWDKCALVRSSVWLYRLDAL